MEQLSIYLTYELAGGLGRSSALGQPQLILTGLAPASAISQHLAEAIRVEGHGSVIMQQTSLGFFTWWWQSSMEVRGYSQGSEAYA